MRRLEVRVVPRNLRWEVSVDGHTRPMIDWLCTRERALEHALETARELADRVSLPVTVVVERGDGTTEDEEEVAA